MRESLARPGRPVHILYVTARFLPENGGTEVHTSEVARRMFERGANVTVLATSRGHRSVTEEWDGGVRIRRIPAWPKKRDYFFAPGLAREIRRASPDLLHCQGYHTLVAPLTMFAALRASIPYIITLHSGGHSSRLRAGLRPLQARLLRPLLRRARAIVAVSQFEADLFARRLRLPVAEFAIIPSGIDLPVTDDPLAPSNGNLVLSIGRLESYKGHHRIIEALPALRRLDPSVRLRLVGGGPAGPRLRSLAARLNVADAVDIAPLDAGSRREMADLMCSAAVVAALSEYESQGLAVQEAIALGCPVVINEGTALAELRGYPNVLTVSGLAGPDEVAGAVSRLLRAPPADRPIMQTWEECVDELEAVYRSVLAA